MAREHYHIQVDGAEVGYVSSGMYAPTLDKYLAMAYLPPELAKVGTEVDVVIRNKPVKAKVVKRPFYVPAYRR